MCRRERTRVRSPSRLPWTRRGTYTLLTTRSLWPSLQYRTRNILSKSGFRTHTSSTEPSFVRFKILTFAGDLWQKRFSINSAKCSFFVKFDAWACHHYNLTLYPLQPPWIIPLVVNWGKSSTFKLLLFLEEKYKFILIKYLSYFIIKILICNGKSIKSCEKVKESLIGGT